MRRALLLLLLPGCMNVIKTDVFPTEEVVKRQIVIKSQKSACSGVIVNATHILTAAHCAMGVNARVFRIDPKTNRPDEGRESVVVSIKYLLDRIPSTKDKHLHIDWPISTGQGDVWMDDGRLADLAVAEIAPPQEDIKEEVAINYTHNIKDNSTLGSGTGRINGQPNEDFDLKFSSDHVRTQNGRWLLTERLGTDKGDSGGPLYTMINDKLTLTGILYGSAWDISGFCLRNIYADTSNFQEFIEKWIHTTVDISPSWTPTPAKHHDDLCMSIVNDKLYVGRRLTASNGGKTCVMNVEGHVETATSVLFYDVTRKKDWPKMAIRTSRDTTLCYADTGFWGYLSKGECRYASSLTETKATKTYISVTEEMMTE